MTASIANYSSDNCKDMEIKISPTAEDLATSLAAEIAGMAERSAMKRKPFTIALSGGSTPGLLYNTIGKNYPLNAFWRYVHLFWGDERCVPPFDVDSNYGTAKGTLLDKIDIPPENIHRVHGEADPVSEAGRYSEIIRSNTRSLYKLPVFDLIILGLGGDGHTASIFPGDDYLVRSDKVCDIAKFPSTGQVRITITVPVINNADNIIFLVTGLNKSKVVADIIDKPGNLDYPAAFIEPSHGSLRWFLDTDAASMLSQWA